MRSSCDPADRYPNASAMAFDLRRVALAMGVGDGRLFLRRALDREFGNDASEVTAEQQYSTRRRPRRLAGLGADRRPPRPGRSARRIAACGRSANVTRATSVDQRRRTSLRATTERGRRCLDPCAPGMKP